MPADPLVVDPPFADTCVLVRGQVQGVGFRPLVWRLAQQWGLSGWVRNEAAGVAIRVRGQVPEAFWQTLQAQLPPLARLEAIEHWASVPENWPDLPPAGFEILTSLSGPTQGTVSTIGPDAAVCPACLQEVLDPNSRRWRYPFTSCTQCGPRWTVSVGIPYDRPQTTLAPFPLCPDCAAEYRDPSDRRFHAETTCCPACGPRLTALNAQGEPLPGDPLSLAVAALQAGQIVAIKGLGGFHLACDAQQARAVQGLRARKGRAVKPFAVMGLNVASLRRCVALTPADAALLQGPTAPIVVCPQARGSAGWAVEALADEVAPGLAQWGVMLPSSPLHALLWHEWAGRPRIWDAAAAMPVYLVMTSANPQGEPIVTDNDEAVRRLRGLADLFLCHDRDIAFPCDDSVCLSSALGGQWLRRARGYVPVPIPLAASFQDAPTVLALGGDLKNTLCILRGTEAYLSPHIGSLDNVATVALQARVQAHLSAVLQAHPVAVAYDPHPEQRAAQLAVSFAGEQGLLAMPVFHHHAHLAALCAEWQLDTDAPGGQLGWAVDGVGLGTDDQAWGGELLHLHGAACDRLATLLALPMPGGDVAARQPWRMALAAGAQANCLAETQARLGDCWPECCTPSRLDALTHILKAGVNCPTSSSLGRWFDAVAGLLGVCAEQTEEGQAAMWLEARAMRYLQAQPAPSVWPVRRDVSPSGLVMLNFAAWWPIVLGELKAGADVDRLAAQWHLSVAQALAELAAEVAQSLAVQTVLLSGGCAVNTLLRQAMAHQLAKRGLNLLLPQRVPPNDAGLALGQAWVAAKQMMKKEGRDVFSHSRAGD